MRISRAEQINRNLREQDWLIDQQVIKDMDDAAREARMATIRLNAITCPECEQSVDASNWQKHFKTWHPESEVPQLPTTPEEPTNPFALTTPTPLSAVTDPDKSFGAGGNASARRKSRRDGTGQAGLPLVVHAVANLFPAMSDDEYRRLVESIRANGQIEPIWTHQNAIIDGRHRYKACTELGIEPKLREWNGQGSLVMFVVGLNLERRHLTSSQKAVIALDIETGLAEEAKERQLAGLKRGQSPVSQKIDQRGKGKAATQAAAAVGTNRQYVSDAKSIAKAAPELLPKVAAGELTIPEAKKLAKQPEAVRAQILEAMTKTDVETRAANAVEKRGKQKPKTNRAGDKYEPQGYDACQTPPEALDPLLPYLKRGWTIWESAAGEKNLVHALYDNGFENLVASDILTEQNFFEFEPPAWDCLVTNPPYSIKYEWIERCYELGKPFALLLPLETLGAKTPMGRFRDDGLEIILMAGRVNFKMPLKGWDGSSAQFPVAWFTWGLNIGAQITYPRAEL